MTELTVLHCAAIGQDYVDKPKSWYALYECPALMNQWPARTHL